MESGNALTAHVHHEPHHADLRHLRHGERVRLLLPHRGGQGKRVLVFRGHGRRFRVVVTTFVFLVFVGTPFPTFGVGFGHHTVFGPRPLHNVVSLDLPERREPRGVRGDRTAFWRGVRHRPLRVHRGRWSTRAGTREHARVTSNTRRAKGTDWKAGASDLIGKTVDWRKRQKTT